MSHLVKTDPNEQTVATQVEKISAAIESLLEQEHNRVLNRSYEFPLGYNMSRQQLTAMLAHLKNKTDSLRPRQQQSLSDESQSWRNAIKGLIIGRSPLQRSTCLIVDRVHQQRHARRLQALMKNTIAFAQGEELAPPFGGVDEIGKLDSTFHEMVQMLNQAKEKEQELSGSKMK